MLPKGNRSKREISKIGLMGPFGFGNLGDAAIQQSMLENVRKAHPDAQIFGFSLNPEDTFKRHGITSFSIGRMAKNGWAESDRENSLIHKVTQLSNQMSSSSQKLVRIAGKVALSPIKEFLGIIQASSHLDGLDLLIVSGGGQLDDYWGGAWHHPYALFLWGLLARLKGVKYLFVSVGAGPLDASLSKVFDKWALSLAQYRSYRDLASKDFMTKIGFVREADPVFPDLAFSLDITRYRSSHPKGKSEQLVVGIGPLVYFRPGVWPEQSDQIYQGYLRKLACFTTWLIERNYKVLLFTGDAEFDRWAINDFKEILWQMGTNPESDQVIEEPIETVDDLMDQLSVTDVVVASKFHGVLLSLLLHKPVLALSYHSKIDELMKDTGQSEYCLSVDDFTEEILEKTFDHLLENMAEAKQLIAQRVGEYQEDLHNQYRKVFFLDD